MNELHIVSRADVFDKEEHTTHVESILPELDLEFVEVPSDGAGNEIDNDDDEFEFPLFSAITSDNTKFANSYVDDDRGRCKERLMKVSLREPSPEVIVQERPRNFYFAEVSNERRNEFIQSSVDYDQIIAQQKISTQDRWPQFKGKVLDVSAHNLKVDEEIRREMKVKKRRPGKKQRLAKKLGAQRESERQERARDIKKAIKKKFHKRGGRKNKKPEVKPEVKPKFRTE
ncbi:LAMI_0E04478g1_1 [Lachancea mirantina]|uniref:LAMI_0E04478g1_1 n=1 Tax=Lachancea mirantina TaxID=1230905 RepID=A0A1G4JKJ6_9SACH|nr:LAMI_0E04478g1_1 [Lachancea mirantina]